MANMKIQEATDDATIGGAERIPAVEEISGSYQPRSISTANIAKYVLSVIQEAAAFATGSGTDAFDASTGSVTWKNAAGALKFASGAQFANTIIAYAFAKAGVQTVAATDTFIVKKGNDEFTMTLTQLTAYLRTQIVATIELSGMTSAESLSDGNLMLVAQLEDETLTNKKVPLSTVRSFILNGLGAYLNQIATETSQPATTEYVFSHNGTVLRKWQMKDMLALANVVYGPSTTTANKVPQWGSDAKTLQDGLAVSTALDSNSTNAQLPTAAAARNYTDNKVAAMVPESTTTGNLPVYANATGVLGTGKGIVTSVAIAMTASDDNIPTEKAVRTGIDAVKGYVDDDVKFTVGTHAQGDLAKFGSNGRNLEAGPTVTTEVNETDSATSDSRIPTEKAVRAAITSAMSQGVAAKEVVTSIRPPAGADDDHVPTELAVAEALDTVVKTGLHADGEIPLYDGSTGALLKGGTSLVTEVRDATNASNAAVATEKAVRVAVNIVQTALDNKKLDKLAAPDEGTDLDASTSRHGLMSAADKAKLEGLVDHNGASEINAALANDDTFLVSDVSAQTVKKSKISRIWDYILNLLHETPLTALTVGADVTTSNATTSAPGLLPKLPAEDASIKYLKGDGTWGVPAGSSVFTPDSGSGGTTGLVPAPAAGDATKVLFGDGTWGEPALESETDHVSIHDKDGLTALDPFDDADELLIYHSGSFKKLTAAQLGAYAQAFQRYDVIWVPAGAITPNLTNSAVAEVLSRSTGLASFDTIRFDKELNGSIYRDSFADFDIVFPDDWNGGSIKLKFYWTPYQSSFGSSQAVRFGAKACFHTNHSAIDIAPASYAYIDDTVSSYNQEHVSSALAITVDGTYEAGKRVHFWLKREASDTTHDTLTTAVSLLGVAIQFIRSGNVEAW